MTDKLFHIVNNERIEYSDDEATAIREEWAKNAAEREAKQYSKDRESDYPDWREQLDQIYHEGIDTWKATVKAVKDAYPKP